MTQSMNFSLHVGLILLPILKYIEFILTIIAETFTVLNSQHFFEGENTIQRFAAASPLSCSFGSRSWKFSKLSQGIATSKKGNIPSWEWEGTYPTYSS